MDIEQITYETFDRVDRLDRDLRKHMKKEKNATGDSTINTTEITSSIKGTGDVDLTGVSAKIDENQTNICENIKGTKSVDLTSLSEKIDNLTSYIAENPIASNFEVDPFKLDEEFVGYTPKETIFNTTDFIECTKPFVLNEYGYNSYYVLACVGVYCESETFDFKITLDAETNASCNLEIYFPDSTIGTGSTSTQTFKLLAGRNIISQTIENVNVNDFGNVVVVYLKNNLANINSFKIEVFGDNVVIVTKPSKFKCFCKYDETIISKLDNNNGYCLKLKTDKMTPADLTKKYELVVQNVKDFQYILTTYKNISYSMKNVYAYAYLTFDGTIFHTLSTLDPFKVPLQYRSEILNVIDNADTEKFFKVFHISYSSSNKDIVLFYAGNRVYTIYGENFLIASLGVTANCAMIYDNYNPMESETIRIILTSKNLTNLLYFKVSSSATTLDLGFGRNVTAYYDKDSRDVLRVYMKVGDKMVRKTVNFLTTTDDAGTTIETASIVEQKIIGTYDYYFETNSEKYLVVKDGEIYMFKNS